MLHGEKPMRGTAAFFGGLVLAVGLVVVLSKGMQHADGTALPEPTPAPFATLADVLAADARVDQVEEDVAATVGALMLLQQQVNTQGAEIATVHRDLASARRDLDIARGELVEVKARAAAPKRARRSPPDPPASSYLQLN